MHLLNIREGRQRERREMVRVQQGSGRKGDTRDLTGQGNEEEKHKQWLVWQAHARRHAQDIGHFLTQAARTVSSHTSVWGLTV